MFPLTHTALLSHLCLIIFQKSCLSTSFLPPKRFSLLFLLHSTPGVMRSHLADFQFSYDQLRLTVQNQPLCRQ
ncbi:hypothetical protein EVA_07726 [gut metagenome]|uniref:Uncharacterized protein n=1 Tax=gut metagenome TaxID=749906 RepID=J9CVC1_9ZZZZ